MLTTKLLWKVIMFFSNKQTHIVLVSVLPSDQALDDLCVCAYWADLRTIWEYNLLGQPASSLCVGPI